jgi:hypothetical protein
LTLAAAVEPVAVTATVQLTVPERVAPFAIEEVMLSADFRLTEAPFPGAAAEDEPMATACMATRRASGTSARRTCRFRRSCGTDKS